MSSFERRYVLTPILVLCLVLVTAGVQAHSPGLSSGTLTLEADHASLYIQLAAADVESVVPMDSDRDADVSKAERQTAAERIAILVQDNTRLSFDARVVQSAGAPQVTFDEDGNGRVTLTFDGSSTRNVEVHIGWLDRLPPAHRLSLQVKNNHDEVLRDQVLTRTSTALSLDLSHAQLPQSRWRLFGDFLHLGIEHIVTGYDHLLFLFGLLIVGQRLRDYLVIISCFTLAHSISLVLATLNYIVLPPAIVEPMIAASIVYVGIENLIRGKEVRHRGRLSFGFGLIHGLGFAGALSEAGIGEGGHSVLVPLLSFNLGVEVGQLGLATIFLSVVYRLRILVGAVDSWPFRWASAASVLVTVLGVYWFLERTLPATGLMPETLGMQ